DLVKRKHMVPLFMKGYTLYSKFKYSKIAIYKKVWQMVESHGQEKCFIEPKMDKMSHVLQSIRRGEAVGLGPSVIKEMGKRMSCQLFPDETYAHMSKQRFAPSTYGFI